MTGVVLVVDDEPAILRALVANLSARGYTAVSAVTGPAALEAAEAHRLDCVILDLGLPGLHGLEVLRRLRAASEVPVVVLTAMDAEQDKVTALELGADDYVTKPFGMSELMARVRVAIRHGQRAGGKSARVVEAGDVRIDLDAGKVTRGGAPVSLTPTEYRLVEVLASNAGRLCTHRFLLDRVWGTGYERQHHYLRVYMANLRRKLDDPAAPAILLTETGMGYRLAATEPPPDPARASTPEATGVAGRASFTGS